MFKIFGASFPTFLLLILLLFTCQVLGQNGENFDPEHLCTLVADGTKLKDPSSCSVHIECRNGHGFKFTCADNLWFDRNTGHCVEPESIKCLSSQPCLGKHKVFTPDPYSCNGYYYCENGEGKPGVCGNGMFFNPETLNCVKDFSCNIEMLPEDYCNIVPEGVFIKVPETCQEYQTCWNSQLHNGSCSKGFYFNAQKGICDLPQNVECSEKEPENPPNVPCYSDGVFISDGISCNGYYYCSAKKEGGGFDKIHGKCPVGRFFDSQEGGQCLPRANVSCSFDRCVTKGTDRIEMVNVQGDGCRGYAMCQHGEEIGRNECPEGRYFDETFELCVKEEVKYTACAIDDTVTTTTTMATATTTTVLPTTTNTMPSTTTMATTTTTTTTTPKPTTTPQTTTENPTTTTNALPPTTASTTSSTTASPTTNTTTTSTPLSTPTSYRKPTTVPPSVPKDRSQYILVPTIEY
uniref:Chitin-binding type-2 domain-containing protein n=1 Tax=Stomoxys calcitrans TaxID=35570 RepID=A0A1I8P0D5_STOCA